MIKSFVLDTNILLGSGKSALYGFADNIVYITGTTLQELDAKKSFSGEIGYNAREVIRELDALRMQGDLKKGVKVGDGICRVEADGVYNTYLPDGYSLENPDNRILSTCIYLAKGTVHEQFPPENFVLVTNDISMRVNASLVFSYAGVDVGIDGYQNDRVLSTEEGYMGYLVDDAADPALIDRLYKEGRVEIGKYKGLHNLQFVILKCGQQSAIAIRKNDELVLLKDQTCFGINKTFNAAQKMALYALLAPVDEIPLVILKGPAGTGKTLLALAAGIDGVYGDIYNKVLIGRSNVENREEKEFGYLPGDLEEKMSPILAPFTDSLQVLLRSKCGAKESNDQISMQIDDMMQTVIEVCPLVYIRGRSLSYSYLIIDEAQNSGQKVIRDVISRAGLGTKVVLLGDPSQIDASTLDRFSCGLEVAWEKMRGVACEVEFVEEESVRSELAKAAIKMMK